MTTNIKKISVFNKIFNKDKSHDIDFILFVNDVKSEKYKSIIEKIRSAENKEDKNKLKQLLPAITTSCKVQKTRKINEAEHSGLIQIDIDDLIPENVADLKKIICQDKYTFCCFISPSGKIKVVYKIAAESSEHLRNFNAIEKYFWLKYRIQIDKATKDVCRLMYYSYDPEIYYNEDAFLFFAQESHYLKEILHKNSNKHINNANLIINEIVRTKTDITQNYDNWLKIIFSLKEIYGTDFGKIVHQLSQYHANYSFEETEKQISACANSKGRGITHKTFFFIAKKFEINTTKDIENKPQDSKQIITNKYSQVKIYLNNKYDLRYNTLALEFEGKLKRQVEFIQLNENDLFVELHEKGLSLSMGGLMALLKSSFVSKYDPLDKYFSSLPQGDGIDYIDKLANYIDAENQEVFNYHFKKWVVRLVACALNPSFYNKQALVLVGATQDTGKSTFSRFLCPPILSNYIIENISIDKDSRIAMAKNFLVNLDELTTMSKADLNAMKALFSMEKMNERLPYDRKNTILPRRASFIGSINKNEFLTDETGSVRWLCFNINGINWNYKNEINIDDVYSQAFSLYKSGTYNYNLTKNDIAENEIRNSQFYTKSIEHELISKYFKPDFDKLEANFKQPFQVVMQLNKITEGALKINHINIGKALKARGFEKCKNSKYDVYGYYLCEKCE